MVYLFGLIQVVQRLSIDSFSTGNKIDDVKDNFYVELEHVFDKFPKYHMKIFLRDFIARVGKEHIF
jgi:hypothetical protein